MSYSSLIQICFYLHNRNTRSKLRKTACTKMFFVLLQVLFYFHQAVFFATLLFLLLWCLSKFLPRRSVNCIHEKFVLITGCDSGFGMESAIRLDQMGFRVFATCLTENAAEKLNCSCSKRLVAFKMDVTKKGDIEKAYSTVKNYLPEGRGMFFRIFKSYSQAKVHFSNLHWRAKFTRLTKPRNFRHDLERQLKFA